MPILRHFISPLILPHSQFIFTSSLTVSLDVQVCSEKYLEAGRCALGWLRSKLYSYTCPKWSISEVLEGSSYGTHRENMNNDMQPKSSLSAGTSRQSVTLGQASKKKERKREGRDGKLHFSMNLAPLRHFQFSIKAAAALD